MSRVLVDWLDTYMEYTHDSEPPDNFRLFNGVSTIAACLQRKVCLPWGANLAFYPNLYILLVGPSGTRKSTSMRPAQSLLNELGIKTISDAITSEALIQEVEASTTTVPMLDGMPFMHCSVTVYSEEFTVFIGYNNQQLMANLCDWYDCKEHWRYKTKHQGVNELHGLWVNLFGATTPELLQSTLPRDAIGGGLTARMILVFEPKKGKIQARPVVTPKMVEQREALLHDLERINGMMGEFTVTEEFMTKYVPWYENSEGNLPFEDDRFSGYLDRRPSHLLKLCMVSSASRDSNMVIEANDFDRAMLLLGKAEKNMQLAFTGIGRSKTAATLMTVLQYIEEKGQCTRAEVANRFYYDSDKREMDQVLVSLETMKSVRIGYAGGQQLIIATKNRGGAL